jgi:hypothetical protein
MTRPSSVESDGIIDQLAVLMQLQETLPIMGSKASMHCGVPRRGYPPDSCAGDDSDAPRGRRQDWQIAGSDRGGAKRKPTALQPASREAFVCGNETFGLRRRSRRACRRFAESGAFTLAPRIVTRQALASAGQLHSDLGIPGCDAGRDRGPSSSRDYPHRRSATSA